MDYQNEEITIKKAEYDDLKISAMKYSMLLQVLIDEMELNTGWDKEENPILFKNKKLSLTLSLIEKSEYEQKLNSLKGGNDNE